MEVEEDEVEGTAREKVDADVKVAVFAGGEGERCAGEAVGWDVGERRGEEKRFCGRVGGGRGMLVGDECSGLWKEAAGEEAGVHGCGGRGGVRVGDARGAAARLSYGCT